VRLEELQANATVRGVLPDGGVTVVSTKWFGSNALELTYKDAGGKVANQLLYRHDEPRLELVEVGRPWSFDGDGALFRLVSRNEDVHLISQPGASVKVSLEIEATLRQGAPENVVRTVTENGRTLKFRSQGFEVE